MNKVHKLCTYIKNIKKIFKNDEKMFKMLKMFFLIFLFFACHFVFTLMWTYIDERSLVFYDDDIIEQAHYLNDNFIIRGSNIFSN